MAGRRPKKPDGGSAPGASIYDAFTEWSSNRGVEMHGIALKKMPGKGVGLVTTEKIAKDSRILFVPEKAIFKPDFKLLQAASLRSASPHAQLTISAMNACIPSAPDAPQPLKTWISTWPTNEDFVNSRPMCWPESLREHLPESAVQPLERQLRDYNKDREVTQSFCQSKKWSETDFRYYWMIVDSRAFHWSPSNPNTKTVAKPKPGYMVMCPYIDYMNHGPSGTTVEVYQRPNGFEVLADRDYSPDTEIHATYGSHSNDKLLVHYGFITAYSLPLSALPAPHNTTDDDIRLDPILLPHIPASVQDQLRDMGFLGNYSLSPATNELCFKTQVAARAVVGDSWDEWEYFAKEGEDLSREYSGVVDGWVGKLLKVYLTDVVVGKKVETLRDMAEQHKEGKTEQEVVAVAMLMERWRQIGRGIEMFLEKRRL